MTPFRAGEVLHLTRAASPQFVIPIRVRVIRVLADRHPPYGWEWIDCYQLGPSGDAIARRELFVLVEGANRLADRPAPIPARRLVAAVPGRPPAAGPASGTAPSRRRDNQRRSWTPDRTVRP